MRYLLFVALLAGCSSHSRVADEYDPWANYEPGPRPTYDQTYSAPSGAEASVARARRAEADGRDDRARVDYHSAFLRDRWHVHANQGYQDLMLRNGLFDLLWREYFDLWQQHTERGDAFYFHLRPLLTRRGLGALTLDRPVELPAETMDKINELVRQAAEHANAGNREEAVAAADNAIALADLPVLHRARIALIGDAGDERLAAYKQRAEESPHSGDAQALHAMVVALTDRHAAANMLRDAYVLELPGFWLAFTLAEICRDLGDDAWTDAGPEPTRDQKRDALGWYATARDFYAMCQATRPADPDTLTGAAYVAGRIERASR